ncbi:unnamed protein product [Parascedosporium putredinis]|uniref:M protein repeat protein n=1 Tax=Parascedosporium putredinis TaxID=1442378 RepID=A0A9P1H3N9_9PEZI|nr:unnamed protein product [Parascedosporium putredinis]CAI7995897.1 unnamed protein product [Parascedosporium putredinis]
MGELDDKAKAEKLAAMKKKARAGIVALPPALSEPEKGDVAVEDAPAESAEPPTSPTQDPASLAQQSKMRSSSFRKGSGPLSPGLSSPDGTTAPEIYRKNVARIEELEKENERLGKEVQDSERRRKKAEEELEELREADSPPGKLAQVAARLRSSTTANSERQNAQLQQQVSRSKHGKDASSEDLAEQLASKSATIESMELELSKLRAALDRHSSGMSSEKEQIGALEGKLARAERAAASAQQELGDLRRNLDRTAEKAVRDSSEKTSVATKLRTVEHELADQLAVRADLETKVDALEQKVATLTTLHREQDSRSQALRREKERVDGEVRDLRSKTEHLEAEKAKLKSRQSLDGGIDDDAVDELVDEGRSNLEKRIRELEAENHDLRRGIWKDRRRELEETSRGGGIGDFIASGINALTGADDDDDFLPDDDDGIEFDETAFRKAQAEENTRRLERIKEVKRGLKNWVGWRLDLIENRRGAGEGVGEIFEI